MSVFSSEVPEQLVTSLMPAGGKCKVTGKTQGCILMLLKPLGIFTDKDMI